MKKLLLSMTFLTALVFQQPTEAQVRVNLNLNMGPRPAWGIQGNYAGDYYYLPEIDCFYDIPRRQFVYYDGYGWINAYKLPNRYRGYDLYRGYKVIVNEPRPFVRVDYYRNRYPQYYNTYKPRVEVYNRYPEHRQNADSYYQPRDNQHYNNKRVEDNRNRFAGRDDDNRRDRDEDNDRGRGRGKGRGRG